MANFPFPRFLKDASEYEACQSYWRGQIDAIAESVGAGGKWQPWMATAYADGKTPLERDGNPIANARCLDVDRAIRILQTEPAHPGLDITGWVCIEKELLDLPREELVISLSLSEKTAPVAQELLRLWMSGGSIEDIQEALRVQTSSGR